MFYSLRRNRTGGHDMVGPLVPGGALAYFKPRHYLSNYEIIDWCEASGFDVVEIHHNLRLADQETTDIGKLLRFSSPEQAILFKLTWQD